ncbi:MAG: DNA-directed RNA polymerase subunit omega [Lachnospiraceae bacterium]|nr:DNA-directed RNA polymerase subunit omega [Lachnospiraceae bacterium]
MLHPSYNDLMESVNSAVEQGEEPVVSSRYSIVIATSKRARQIIQGDPAMAGGDPKKPLSLAVNEVYECKVNILPEGTDVEELKRIAVEEAIERVKKEKLEEEAAKAAKAEKTENAENTEESDESEESENGEADDAEDEDFDEESEDSEEQTDAE